MSTARSSYRGSREIRAEHARHIGRLYRIMAERKDAIDSTYRSRLSDQAKNDRIDALGDDMAALRYALRALGDDV